MRNHLQETGENQKLLISFHGIPQEYTDKGDPYYEHLMSTADALAFVLKLASSDWSVGFQSRFGPKKWIQPYTDEQLKKWAKEGIKSVDIFQSSIYGGLSGNA
jgi:ferrochelatase